MNYFNTLVRSKFEKEPTCTQNEILELVEYFEKVMSTGDLSIQEAYDNSLEVPIITIIRPKQALVNKFYEFLLERYKKYIDNQFIEFFVNFNNEIYGLELEAQKRIALPYFNSIYKDLKIVGFETIERNTSKLGIENIGLENRLKFLSNRRGAYKMNMSNRKFILEYLYGNVDFFNHQLMNENELINDFIFFESQLKILVSLNDNFKFELDGYFTEAAKQMALFDKYVKALEFSPTLFEYVYIKAKSFTNNKYANANANALFVALKKENKIKNSPKDYINFMEEAFQIPMSKISYPLEHNNRKHHEKVDAFTNEIRKLEA